jgi:hypothetical protein
MRLEFITIVEKQNLYYKSIMLYCNIFVTHFVLAFCRTTLIMQSSMVNFHSRIVFHTNFISHPLQET